MKLQSVTVTSNFPAVKHSLVTQDLPTCSVYAIAAEALHYAAGADVVLLLLDDACGTCCPLNYNNVTVVESANSC